MVFYDESSYGSWSKQSVMRPEFRKSSQKNKRVSRNDVGVIALAYCTAWTVAI